ncbi:MAG: SDR family oxidoreductase [Rhodobacteraceae bacterium]|nr:SDR family oxidoreductase [Paracoccaceae bacterium]
MNQEQKDKTSKQAALITGGAIRLGKKMALALAGRGYDIALHYHKSRDEVTKTQEELSQLGVKVVTLQADLTDDQEIIELIPRTVQALKTPINLLVNNASIFKNDSIENATLESWDEHISTNLKAPFFLTRDFVNQLPMVDVEDTGTPLSSGLVVNIVDQRVLKPTPYFATYTVAKMALWSLTRSAAIALAPKVRINAIGPGPTIKAKNQSLSHYNNQRFNTILRRGSNPNEVVAALNYLIDAHSVTGQLICPDGGQHLTWNPKYNGEDY